MNELLQLKKQIKERRDFHVDALICGRATSFDDYKLIIGKICSFDLVNAMIDEMINKLKKDEDDE